MPNTSQQNNMYNIYFYKAFKWAIPDAFSDAVNLCLFAEGDLIYDHIAAYTEEWSSAFQKINYSIQVKTAYSDALLSSESENQKFLNNWNSEIRVDLFHKQQRTSPGQIHTTQGRLYTLLWKGDLSILDASTPPPQPPLNVRDAAKNIKEASLFASQFSSQGPSFVMARDYANPVSRAKYNKVLLELKKHLAQEPLVFTPSEAGIKNWENLAPTVEVVIFDTQYSSQEELHDAVKKAVYIPAKDAKREMFRIAAHGAIVPRSGSEHNSMFSSLNAIDHPEKEENAEEI